MQIVSMQIVSDWLLIVHANWQFAWNIKAFRRPIQEMSEPIFWGIEKKKKKKKKKNKQDFRLPREQ